MKCTYECGFPLISCKVQPLAKLTYSIANSMVHEVNGVHRIHTQTSLGFSPTVGCQPPEKPTVKALYQSFLTPWGPWGDHVIG